LRDNEATAGGYATSALRRTPSVLCEELADRRRSAGHRGLWHYQHSTAPTRTWVRPPT